MMKKIQPGFTLIELMVVVGILGILILFSSISYISLKQRTALNNTVDDLVGAARTVQGWAIAGQDGTAFQCLRVLDGEIKSPCLCTISDCKLYSKILAGVAVTVSPAVDINFTRLTGVPELVDRLTGIPEPAAPVTFTICSGSLTPKQVVVSLNGKISSKEDGICI